MNVDTVWQPNALPSELATTCLTRSVPLPAIGERREKTTAADRDLLLLAPVGDGERVEAGDQLERLKVELGELGVTPITPNRQARSRVSCHRALVLRGFQWGERPDHLWRSKRGIVLGGGASRRDKLAVKAGIEAVLGIHGLIAFYVADDSEGDSSYIGADGDLALFGGIAGLRGTDSDHAVNRCSSAGIQVGQSSGILEAPALAAEIAVATARVIAALMPAGR